ncbi:MAG: GNAT family N-acetyltransferase [Acidimicrobiales bacterium]
MAPLDRIDLRPLHRSHLASAALLAARGMRDNPLHLAAIGDNPDRRVQVMQRLFARVLPLQGRPTIGAWQGDRLVGVASSAEPGRCQPSMRDRLHIAPAVLQAGGATLRLGRWFSTWAKHDSSRLHSHFGPIAVDPDLQGRGIGGMLLTHYCHQLDQRGLHAYLETDKPQNVTLYERFGFTVTGEADVIGVKNWFMTRTPATHQHER